MPISAPSSSDPPTHNGLPPGEWRDALHRLGYGSDALGRAHLAGDAEPGKDWLTPLTSLGAVAFEGRDTTRFLQAQLTADVAAAPAGHWLPAAWCDPRGRALAMFMVCVINAEHVVLVAPAAVLDTIMPKLALYILRSKTRPTRLDGEQALVGIAAGASAPRATPGTLDVEGDGALVINIDAARTLVIDRTKRQLGRLDAHGGDGRRLVDERRWWQAEIQNGRPQVWPPTMGAFVPQMTNLEIIGGVSFSKGCYPGQEVVARTQYLGRLKRRTFNARLRLHGGDSPLPGTDVRTADGQEAGRVMQDAALTSDSAELLVVLRTELVNAGTPLFAAGHEEPLDVAPPHYGLQSPADLTTLR